MRQFNFDLVLSPKEGSSPLDPDQFLDEVEERLFEAFQGDVTPGVCENKPVLYCTIEAGTIGDALNRVVQKVIDLNLSVELDQVVFHADRKDQVAVA